MTEMNNSGTKEQVHKDTEIVQLVSFTLGEEEYGIDILKVQEINRMMEITHVPKCAYFVEGVVNLRGKVIPVLDLRKRFGLEPNNTKETRIIVVDIDGRTVGLIVDSVSEVLRLPKETIDPTPPMISTSIDAQAIKGVGKLEDRLIIIIDIEKFLSDEEKTMLNNF